MLHYFNQVLEAPLDSQNYAEYRRALNRVLIVGGVTLILGFLLALNYVSTSAFFVAFVYFCFSLAWARLTRHDPGDINFRRMTTMMSDFCMICIAMHMAGTQGAALYPFLLAITVSIGVQYGRDMLAVASPLAVCGFVICVVLSDYWQTNLFIAFTFIVGLLIVPWIISPMLKKNVALQNQLDKQSTPIRLPNRPYFVQRTKEEIAAAHRYEYAFSVITVELDGLEAIEVKYGRPFVDGGVKISEDRLKNISRKSDICARLNDQKFGMLLRNLHTPQDINNFSRKLLDTLAKPIFIEGQNIQFSANIGISLYPNHGDTADALLKKANYAMTNAKNRGKNHYTLYLEEVAS